MVDVRRLVLWVDGWMDDGVVGSKELTRSVTRLPSLLMSSLSLQTWDFLTVSK